VLGRFSRNARVAVAMAQEEAGELDLDEVRPSHVLVGVLQAAGAAGPATSDRAHELGALLSGYGLTADVVRAQLVEANTSGDSSFDDDAEALELIGIDLRAVSRERSARTPSTTPCVSLAAGAAAAGTSRSRAQPRKCSSWHYEKRCCTKTTRSAASTSCWASFEVATKRPSA
jgi:hypothetical protein